MSVYSWDTPHFRTMIRQIGGESKDIGNLVNHIEPAQPKMWNEKEACKHKLKTVLKASL